MSSLLDIRKKGKKIRHNGYFKRCSFPIPFSREIYKETASLRAFPELRVLVKFIGSYQLKMLNTVRFELRHFILYRKNLHFVFKIVFEV